MKLRTKILCAMSVLLLAAGIAMPIAALKIYDSKTVGRVTYADNDPAELDFSVSFSEKLMTVNNYSSSITLETGKNLASASVALDCAADGLYSIFDGSVYLDAYDAQIVSSSVTMQFSSEDSMMAVIIWHLTVRLSDEVTMEIGVDDESGKILYLRARRVPVTMSEDVYGEAGYNEEVDSMINLLSYTLCGYWGYEDVYNDNLRESIDGTIQYDMYYSNDDDTAMVTVSLGAYSFEIN